ncbi:Uncharacterised protein [Porphyromonas macacae]|uniref:Lipoprotein n=1 Tax=Porphyromonas macacae TaxID=28115 RepID=A0A379E5N3_9PORP|nr:hypothetical protein [Porphyromonas macacae]SUB88018.1 Uncharacterised protein [Porphyromonas macacae]
MKNTFLFFCLGLCFLVASCNSKNDPAPGPEEPAEYSLQLKTSEIVELKQFNSGKLVQDVPEDKVKEYFGEIPEITSPVEIRFEKDHITVLRQYDIAEKYKSQWKNNELYIFDESTGEWLHCGNKSDNKEFVLNVVFLKESRKNDQRSLMIMKQMYGTKAKMNENAGTSALLLKVNYVFEGKR